MKINTIIINETSNIYFRYRLFFGFSLFIIIVKMPNLIFLHTAFDTFQTQTNIHIHKIIGYAHMHAYIDRSVDCIKCDD